MLRKAAFSIYPGLEKPPFSAAETYRWVHLRHCVDTLMQTLQCSASTEILTMTWMEDFGIWHDASTNHKCRDFNAVLDWGKRRAVDPEKIKVWARMSPPSDRYEWPAPWLRHSDLEN